MLLQEITGRIFNIQKYCIHDGPGIRDVIFMKGCPLKCTWCSNPESQSSELQLAYNKTKCIGAELCGDCIGECTSEALSVGEDNKIVIDREKCTNCQRCVEVCCSKALQIFGKVMTVDEVIQNTLKQESAWRSNGGITISGGEPLVQADFVMELLRKYKGLGVHTAIETTGYVSWEKLANTVPFCNLIFYDIKLMDSEQHKKHTGVKNSINIFSKR